MFNDVKINFEDSPSNFWNLYNNFVSNFEFIHPFYCESNFVYEKEYFSQNIKNSSNKSFILKEDNTIYFAFLGIITTDQENNNKLSYFAKPCFSLNIDELSKHQKKTIEKTIISILSEFKGQFELHDYYFESKFTYLSEFLLLNYDTKVDCIFKNIIDLKKDIKLLKANVRKSYKSLINWGIREQNITLYTHENIEKKLINDFKSLHIMQAKKQTRNDATWDSQYKSIKDGQAFMAAGYRDGEMITAGYFLMSKSLCYYFSSASMRDLFDKPLFHSLMWSSIVFAKNLGIKFFEVGNVITKNQELLKSEKQILVSKFQSGFGGQFQTQFLISHLFK